MALFHTGMDCPLCNDPLGQDRTHFGTWGVWLPSSDRLNKYCDAALHWDCYAEWKYRARFARSYFEFWVEHEKENAHWTRTYLDDDILVTINPDQSVKSTWVCLAATGSRFNVKIDHWEEWLIENHRYANHAVELEALVQASDVLRRHRPSKESLSENADFDRKKHLWERLEEDARQQKARAKQKRKAVVEHNALCQRAMIAIKTDRFRCPVCQQESTNYRLATRDEFKSQIICRDCGHVIDPEMVLLKQG